ncbi:unnamed protein product, partial [Heterosigma akashiwo]
RGHRQRGAGTVATDKGPQEHGATGTVLQSWQRMPTKLLHEYTQREKKPNPHYHPVGGGRGHRQRVVVPDGKNKAKDLSFATEQCFDSIAQAKEHSALLALHHLQPTLPLERKLPDPYKDIWLETAAAAKAAQRSTLGGLQVAEIKPDPPSGMDGIWGEPPGSESAEVFSPLAKPAPKKFALSSDRRFASQQEAAAARQASREKQNKFKARREAQERANSYPQVDMTRRMRTVLEAALGLGLGDGAASGDITMDPEVALAAMGPGGVEMVAQVTGQGFGLDQALRAWLGAADGEGEGEGPAAAAGAAKMIEWLCLHLPEAELPAGFDPQSGALDVVLATSADPAVRAVCGAYGFRPDEAEAAVAAARARAPAAPADQLEERAVLLLAGGLRAAANGGAPPPPPALGGEGAGSASAAAAGVLEDEMLAMEAIYEGQLTQRPLASGGKQLRLDLAPHLEGVRLDVFFPEEGCYPNLPPSAILVTGPGLVDKKAVIQLQLELARHALTLERGEPMLYEIILFAQSSLQEVLTDSSTRPRVPRLFGTAPAPKPAPKTTTPALEAKGSAGGKGRGKGGGRQGGREDDGFWSRRAPRSAFDPGAGAYQAMAGARALLPAAAAREEFLGHLRANQVVLVSGETGCGKTTQVPQFVLEEAHAAGRPVKLAVCQPRRIAAVGVAARVAEEVGERVGGTVGYMIRGEARAGPATQLLFCTTGILLRRLQADPTLRGLTHLVVDEVHERHLDADFLLALLKTVLPRRPDLKVCLMSATLEAERFAGYLAAAARLAPGRRLAPVLTIPGRTFPVREFYLEDVLERTGYMPRGGGGRGGGGPAAAAGGEGEAGEEGGEGEWSAATLEALGRLGPDAAVDNAVVVELLRSLTAGGELGGGSVLVFMSGVPEITRLCQDLARIGGLWVLPLHGNLTPKDQQLVFKAAPPGQTKVVVSTNIAETSITIPDCTAVIDSGRVKQMVYDPAKQMPCLLEGWAAQDSMTQRKGRAGRVRAGVCYRLLRAAVARFSAHTEPEMKRVPLDQLILQILSLDIGSPEAILASAIDPPSRDAIEAAMVSLSLVGALTEDKKKLSPLGYHLAALPTNAKIGKMLVYGAVLGCLDPILTIAAGLSTRSPFLKPKTDEERQLWNAAQLKFSAAAGGKSDHCALAVAYAAWRAERRARAFCDRHGLSWFRLKEIEQLREQLARAVADLGFRGAATDCRAESWKVVKSAVCAGLYPSVVQVHRPSQKYAEMAHGNERVFIHPSSVNFSQAGYKCPWLVYNEKISTSKVFILDSTEVSPYALLLFGGKITVDALKGVVEVDEWIKFSAVGRIAALMKALRQQLDRLLTRKIEDPGLNISESEAINAAVEVILTSGLGA